MNYFYGSFPVVLICLMVFTSSVLAKNIYTSEVPVIKEITPEVIVISELQMPDDYEESYSDMIEGVGEVKEEWVSTSSAIGSVKPKLSNNTFEVLQRVVEAEVTGDEWAGLSYDELLLCKVRVAQVFINRANNPDFTSVSTLYDALTYPGASATLIDGRYYEVEVTDMTIEACNMALDPTTPDYSAGALYFLGGSPTKCRWADSYLFTDEVGHSFFK